MKTFKEFCERYQLDIDVLDSKKEYLEYMKNLEILTKISSKNKDIQPEPPHF